MNLLNSYTKLNNSFKESMIYHIGGTSGFFSEYNNMILGMLYCLRHQIKFYLYSGDANFSVKSGWTDYFLPFTQSYTSRLLHVSNNRYNINQNWRRWIRRTFYNRIDYFTYELFDTLRIEARQELHYHIPELNIDGDVKAACKKLIELTWNFNSETKTEINKKSSLLNLPEKYIGIHIRGGDKYLEGNLYPIEAYMNKAFILSNIRKAFILTDDYRIFEDLNKNYPDWTFFTLCGKNERGYFLDQLNKNDKKTIYNTYINLFASIEILAKSELFIGTFSSNPGMYLGMRMPEGKCFGVDSDTWMVW
ncbi:MAG: hypothetical protein LBU57_04880 [Dysgonamonadaceae bacterium]|jgi:hypothetical protein|nr:hypothetical protein [Dysgonamonadaceae bacterium]